MADQACTTADVKTQLRITDAADDALISAYIDAVTDWMQWFTGRLLVPHSSATFLLDTAYGSTLDVRRYGVRAVSALNVASTDQPDSGGTYAAITSSLITLRPPELDRDPGMPATSIVVLGAGPVFRNAINGAQVTATTGPTATPERVKRVCIEAVATAYQSRKAGASGVIGVDDAAQVPWSAYFGWGSPQRKVLEGLRMGGARLGIA